MVTNVVKSARVTRWTNGLRGRKILLWIAAIAVALTSTVLVAGQIAKARVKAQHPPIGQMIDIGGYRLHLNCQGSGETTVILEAGGGEPQLDWALVQPDIAKQARVCAYDRAGLGWSDPSPRPRTAAVMAEELHTLLERARISGPYVLVGHSLGGLIARQFAVAHPHDVRGMVLVDSASEGQIHRIPEPVRALMSNTLPARLGGLAADMGLLALFPGIVPAPRQLPADAAAVYQALNTTSSKAISTALAEIAATEADPTPRPETLGDIPLVVIRHGRPLLPMKGAITPEVSQQYEATWAQMQNELAALSPRGRVVVAEGSGHGIQIDRPDVVIAAIRNVLAAMR
jgi:pimeloyl-ACP methyl ester carboxylesterase